MGILDRLKKTREDDEDEDEDSQDGDEESDDEESDDEDSGRGGLRGRFGAFRGIGGNAAGMLGKVLKRGGGDDNGDGDDDGDDDEVTGVVVAATSPVVTTDSPGESVVFSSSAEPSDEDDAMPLADEAPVAGTPTEAPEASGNFDVGDIFSVKLEVDPALRDLAMSQDAITARELADDLETLLGQLARISHVE